MKSVQVNNIQAFNEALTDETVGRIVLLNDLNWDITTQRKGKVDFTDLTLTGNLSMQQTKNGTVAIGSGVITGDLSIDTPNTTVINHADVDGQTTIEDVDENTFDNSGELDEVKFVDPNGGWLINRNSTAVGTLVINSPTTVIEKKLEGFKLVDYSIETLNQQKLLRHEIIKLNTLLSGDWNDEAFVESFI